MADYKKLLADLYPSEEKPKEKNFLDKCYCTTKDYFTSPFSVLGAVIGAGTVYTVSFIVGSAYGTSDGISQLIQHGDWQTALYSLPASVDNVYQHGRDFASQWTAAGAAGGQFVAYRLKNSVKSFLGGLMKK